MTSSVARARATLDAWRDQHADRLDPIRFHFMEALERRASTHDGEARRILDDRLSTLLAAYAGELERAEATARDASAATPPGTALPGLLATLTHDVKSAAMSLAGDPAAGAARARSSTYPELEALAAFRDIWSRVRAESQVRQSLEQVPTNAGPLNAGSLVHRALTLMRELSPGYLRQFLSYVDALSGIEQLNFSGTSAAKDAPRAAKPRKPARRKPRDGGESN